jgi:hypothetical protein
VRSLRITEPATMLTDFAIAVACTAFASGVAPVAAQWGARDLWALSFAATAAAAVVGGVFHGFALHLEPAAKRRLWKATQYLMGVTGLAILAAGVVAFTDAAVRPWLLVAALAKFAAYVTAVRRRDDYSIVILDYGASMLALAALAAVAWVRTGAAAAPWLVSGVAVSGIAAAVQVKKVAPHPRFNHNDLYHVIQLVALYLFFRGGVLLGQA